MNRGKYNIKGVNYQQWSAMALFLQYLKFNDFESIHLEAPKSQDFDLLFKDKKIICEAKNWQGQFSTPHLLKIIKNIRGRITLEENDEVLIVGSNVSDKLIGNIENYKYLRSFRQKLKSRFKNYSEAELELLPRIKFWQIDKDVLENIVYALFSEAIRFWLPQEDLKEKLKAILIDKFYEGSSIGRTYTKSEFLTEIQSISKKAITKTTLFNDEFKGLDKQFSNLIQDIKGQKKPQWGDYDMSSLSAQPNKMFFVLEQIKAQKFDLQKWERLWNVISIKPYYYSLFNVFENNLDDKKENKKYIFKFIKDNIQEIKKFYQQDFFDVDVVKITKKILEDDKDNKLIEDAFEIVEKLITEKRGDIFYLKAQRDSSWERNEVAKLLKEIYLKANPELRERIYKLIVDTFNLVKDDGNFSHYTPREIFEILRLWLEDDFKNNFKKIINKIISQYQRLYGKYKGKDIFNGRELSGGMTSSTDHHYTVGDRHFVGFVLEPAIRKYYDDSRNKKQAWSFILQNCISKTDAKTKNKVIKKSVSKNRPDFLNRTVLLIVLERYEDSNEEISDEAFEILKEFILSRKGIPHKSDLIYQALRGRPQLSDDKKWKLIKVSMNEYGVPVSVFIEEIVSELAKKDNPEAKKALKDWLKNPKYYEKFRFEMNMIQNIRAIFESDFNYAVNLFEGFINSSYFINKQDSFESYGVATLLYDILKKDHKRGLKIIKDISKQKSLTKNQQIILCFSLFSRRGNDQLDDVGLLEYIYEKFINPFLNSLDNDINKIVEKLTFSQAREAFVQFAERLARNKKIKEALRIIEVFVNDPDPYLPGKDPEDPKNEYNEHQRIENGEEPHSITSTRGWCGWVLMKCLVLEGRSSIDDIINLTKQLAIGRNGRKPEKNWYVKHMACFALARLAQIRLNIMPNNKEILFLNDNKERALKMASKIEKIAFNLLDEIALSSLRIQKALAKSILHVFDHIRILGQGDALKFVNIFRKFPDEAIAEAAPLFIFFAEFRKNAFRDWKWKTDKYYNDLGPDKYDDKKFKKILLEVIDKIEPKHRFSFAAQFEHLLRDLDYKREDGEKLFEIGYHYLDYLAEEYNHNLSNIIYMTIKDEMGKKHHFDKWHALYLKYLEREKDFYGNNFKPEKSMEMYWWPSHYNEDILTFIHQKAGKDKFLEAFNIITQFPKELEIHASDKIISLLEGFSKTNKTIKVIVGRLFEKNPSKYYNLMEEWKKKTKK